ncbi:MAG: N-acetylmuramoyl-L-alanine amidase family protein [Lachnospiraceae bacterium]|nr:N-acetylmuramoyl-L-alanine amidase family protein [Lachnospiraceae bacterium]
MMKWFRKEDPMKRKILAVLLSLVMLFTFIPMVGYADTEAAADEIALDQKVPDETESDQQISDEADANVTMEEATVTEEATVQKNTESRDVPDGWVDEDGYRYYYRDSKMVTGWQTIDGKRYYFDPDTYYMYTGICEIDGEDYFLGVDGAAASGWAREDRTYYSTDLGPKATETTWYYTDSNGALQYGWKKLSGNWYYFDPDTGEMATGFFWIDGADYYFNASGVMQTGWIKSNEMTGYTEWYYANSKGVLQDGWQKISNKWYYFDYEMYTGYEEIDGKYYFFNKSGAWVSSPSGWQENKYGEWYYFRNGKAVTEWQKISGKWYYFYRDFAVMCNTYVYVDGKSYMFNKNGTWISNPNGWISDFEGDWYYFRNGKALTGWQKISSKWYYFGDEDLPIMFANRYEEIDGKYYYFNSSGVWISKPEGWRKSNDEWFYFKNGKPVTGWLQISGKWYLFYKDEGWMITGWWDVNNKWYYFNSSGVMQTGIVTIGDLTYNLGSNGAWDGK